MSIISPAFAQGAAASGFDFLSLAPLILIFIVFYFFLIRPQQKKAQQQKEMLSALRRGDKVLTNGGIIGTITKIINEREIQLEIAEGVRVRVIRALVADVLAKTDPQKSDDDANGVEDASALEEKTEKKQSQRKKQ